MRGDTFKLEGFQDIDRALGDLGRATGKNVLRRALISAAEPMARLMRQAAPKGDDLDLSESIDVSPKLSDRQAQLHRKMFGDDRAAVEVFVGPGPDPAAWAQEFGNINHGPQPYLRPAFDEDHRALIGRARVELWDEISKAVARARRKSAGV